MSAFAISCSTESLTQDQEQNLTMEVVDVDRTMDVDSNVIVQDANETQSRSLGQAGCSGNFPDGTFFQVYKSADTGEWNICSGSPWTCTVIPAATANAHCNQK